MSTKKGHFFFSFGIRFKINKNTYIKAYATCYQTCGNVKHGSYATECISGMLPP